MKLKYLLFFPARRVFRHTGMDVSKVSIKICVAASSGGAIIVDDTLTLAGGKSRWREREVLQFLPFFKVGTEYIWANDSPNPPLT